MAKKPKKVAAEPATDEGGEATHFSVVETVHVEIRGVLVTFKGDRKYPVDHDHLRALKKAGIAVTLE